MRDGAEPGDVQIVGELVGHVEPEPRLVMNRQLGLAGQPAVGLVDGRDLVDHLLEVQRDHELVGVGAARPGDAAIGHRLVDKAEFQLLVVLVQKQAVIERGVVGSEGQGDHVPAPPLEIAGILPDARQERERAEIFVPGSGDLDLAAGAAIFLNAVFGSHPVWPP